MAKMSHIEIHPGEKGWAVHQVMQPVTSKSGHWTAPPEPTKAMFGAGEGEAAMAHIKSLMGMKAESPKAEETEAEVAD